MKGSILCICLLASLLGLTLAKVPIAAPKSDKLYGISTGFGGQYTETILQTVSIDITTGIATPFVNNVIYAGSSITFDGISTLDITNGILHYATDFAAAFIWGTDVQKKQIAPAIDVGASSILDVKYNADDANLYFLITDSTNAVLYGSYSTGNGPAQIIANFTTYLESGVGEIGQGAIGSVSSGNASNYYFASYGSSFAINTYNATTGDLFGVSLSRDCSVDKYFSYLHYDSSNNVVWGVQETIKNSETHYFLSVADPVTGRCNSTKVEGLSQGIITCWTFSPTTNNVYFAVATDSGAQICSATLNPVLGSYNLGTPTCVPTSTILADIEVDWTGGSMA